MPIISDSVKWNHYEFEPVKEESQQKAVKEAINALVKVLDNICYFPEANKWIGRATCKLMGIDYTIYSDFKKRALF